MRQADYEIVFDGGAIGNPGRGYGSYLITGPHGLTHHARHEYGDRVTNNQAEYRTLIHALSWLRAHLNGDVGQARIVILGDSQLVINQVNGAWKVKHADLKPRHAEVIQLLTGFGHATLQWQPRAASVALLGH